MTFDEFQLLSGIFFKINKENCSQSKSFGCPMSYFIKIDFITVRVRARFFVEEKDEKNWTFQKSFAFFSHENKGDSLTNPHS